MAFLVMRGERWIGKAIGSFPSGQILLTLPGSFDITPWADRVQWIEAEYAGAWDLPAIGAVTAPAAVLIRPDGYVAWVRDRAQSDLADALTAWFGPPTVA